MKTAEPSVTRLRLGRTPGRESSSHGSAGYLGCLPDHAYGVLHAPEGARSGHGIVIVPPLASRDLATHRVRRHWAEALASAGHSAIRLDLPGVGDSAGTPLGTHRLTAWIDAVNVAAAWLRDEAGCTRITALGIDFGGMLAWLAAADDPAIDDLILWSVPSSGRRLVREIRAAAMLNIDRDLPREMAVTAGPTPLIDDAGEPVSDATMLELSSIDLRRQRLARPQPRRALLLARSAHPGDAAIESLLHGAGVEVTRGDGSELDEIMRYVQASVTPAKAIAASLDWLAAVTTEPTDHGPVEARLPTVTEMAGEPTRLRERIVALPVSSGVAHAIVTEPAVAAAGRQLTVVFVNASADRRIGPNRLWVDAARRWATRGVTSVRVDPPGLGDASGDEHSWDRQWDIFSDRKVAEQQEIIAALRARGVADHVVLVGFCSGAFRALRAASGLPDVVGTVLVAPPAFRRGWWTTRIRSHWIADWTPLPRHGRAKIMAARLAQTGLRLAGRLQSTAVQILQFRRNGPEAMLTSLAARGTHVLVLLKQGYWATEQLSPPARRNRLGRVPGLQLETLPGGDARFRPAPAQAWVDRQLDGALDRILADASRPSETR